MARNQEKAQSMLYRFREAQAVELGLAVSRDARRPRLASSCSNLRECEKWRGEILREISRKVSKIQDMGLTDYEVRDLNDEINKLLREKRHWENQIVALGGANYKRGVPTMLDDSGKEVPGTRGYKYFGRAKDLPGVRELFNRTEEQEAELESFRSLKYKRFASQPSSYYGDEDEEDGVLLAEEAAAEEAAWKAGCARIVAILERDGHGSVDLGLALEDGDASAPVRSGEIPRPAPTSLKGVLDAQRQRAAQPPPDAPKGPKSAASGKRKASATQASGGKRAKGKRGEAVDGSAEANAEEEEEVEAEAAVDTEMASAEAPAGTDDQMQGVESTAKEQQADYASLLTVLDPQELSAPTVLDRAATEKFILQARKRALRQEYIG